MFITKRAYQLWIAGAVSLCCLASTSLGQAQVTSGGTVSTITTSDNLSFSNIVGSQARENFFHGFGELSAPRERSGCSNNALNVGNIANGNANLFLLDQGQVLAKAEFGASVDMEQSGEGKEALKGLRLTEQTLYSPNPCGECQIIGGNGRWVRQPPLSVCVPCGAG